MTSSPVLSLEEVRALEAALFGGDEGREWPAMKAAAQALVRELANDFLEAGPVPERARVLLLVGKGHNGGDALLAGLEWLGRFPASVIEVIAVFPEKEMRPLALRALRELVQRGGSAVQRVREPSENYDVVLDGIFGFQARKPSPEKVLALCEQVNALPVRVRAAVDLPSGLGEARGFKADFTYGTGSVKAPILAPEVAVQVGRIRFLDLGFFEAARKPAPASDLKALLDTLSQKTSRILAPAILNPLRALRSSASDKRTYGHVMIVGGSRRYPGAVLMSVLAALKSGAGLVTAFVPESLVASYAARVPEAMWVAWPETESGGLALEGVHLVQQHGGRATSWVLGPGLGKEPETQAALLDLVGLTEGPLLLDADALQPEVIARVKRPFVVTPHAGEYARISGGADASAWCRGHQAVAVLKGPITRVVDGEREYFSFHGGPALARGGSGDILSGIVGGRLAQRSVSMVEAVCESVVWHGRAADFLARERGQVAVCTTELLEFLPRVLREENNGTGNFGNKAGAAHTERAP